MFKLKVQAYFMCIRHIIPISLKFKSVYLCIFPSIILLLAEVKVWKEIHSKLASIPYSIDKICMPLVKLINDGHFFSTVDKGEQLTRHQIQGGNLPFAVRLQFIFLTFSLAKKVLT